MTTSSIYSFANPGTGSLGISMPSYNPMDDLKFLHEPDYSLSGPGTSQLGVKMPMYNPMSNDPVPPATGVIESIFNWLEKYPVLSNKNQQGWGNLALGTAQAGLGAYLGMKQYGLAKKAFEHQKDAWNKEYEVNKNLTNERLETRQNRRIAESGVTGMQHQDTASFMSRYGVK